MVYFFKCLLYNLESVKLDFKIKHARLDYFLCVFWYFIVYFMRYIHVTMQTIMYFSLASCGVVSMPITFSLISKSARNEQN